MNKNQFINKHANLNISQAELDRKWRLQLQEQQDAEYQRMVFEAIQQQSVNSSPSGVAGGGGSGNPNNGWIETALSNMNTRYSEVTALVPNIYNFWDDYVTGEGPILTGIEDGGDDMYDGGNFMNTNLTANWDDIKEGQIDGEESLEMASILYTHTQASNEDDDEEYNNPPMDGKIKLGDSYFGAGSKYFTNMYPGLFIMVADDISVSEFNISGDVGSDSDTVNGGDVIVGSGWSLFYKNNYGDSSDPSINHLILVPGTPAGITHEFEDDDGDDNDDHRISGIEDRSRIIYAVVARQPGEEGLSVEDAILVSQKILEITEVPTYNFDITANWSLTTPAVVDEASFKTFLESGEDGDGELNNLTDVVITDFLLVGNQLTCNLSASGTDFHLAYTEVSAVNGIGNIIGLENLTLEGNQLSNFIPSIALPSSLLTLRLGANQIVTFNPLIALPNSLQTLELFNNQIVTFDPSIALPSSLEILSLNDNQIVTFDPSIALPSGLQELSLSNNQIVTFDPSIALPSGLTDLALFENQIVTFDPTLALPSSLEILDLNYNQIVNFDPSIALPNSLLALYLNTNQIVTFDPTIPLPSGLLDLSLADNQIVTFDPSIALPNLLQILGLNGNQIVTFDPTTIPSGLRTLWLSNNQIVTFDPTIALPSGLQYLNLQQNQIVTFDPTIALPSSLQYLALFENQIVTFDPTIALPSSLEILDLGSNQIVMFDPSIGLPSSLETLVLSHNQIVTFNPTILLPSGLRTLWLSNNQMTTAGYTGSEPWANTMSVVPGRGSVFFNNNPNSVSGTNLRTILIAKGWSVIG